MTICENLIPTRKNVKQWKQAVEIISQIKKICENKHTQAQKIIDNEQAQCDLITGTENEL